MKICLLTSEFPPVIGGIASHVYELARALIADGLDVTVVHPEANPITPAKDELPGGRVLRPKLIKAQPFYTWHLRRWLTRHIATGGYDLIHVHGMRPLAAAKYLGIPLIFTNHTSGFLARLNANFFRKWRTRNLLWGIDYLLGPSDELVESARVLGYRGPARMIANGVDATRFMPGPSLWRAEWGIPSDELVVVLARRLAPKNGVIWFAQAVAELPLSKVRIVIAGDGTERDQMTEILRSSGKLDRCLFLGSVPNMDMPDLYRAADIAVLPSLAEATSIAGLEAMACCLPLVGTKVGGIPAILAHGQSGLLVPPKDPKAMAEALAYLIDHREVCLSMGQFARHRIENEFSWPMIARQTQLAYKACLSP